MAHNQMKDNHYYCINDRLGFSEKVLSWNHQRQWNQVRMTCFGANTFQREASISAIDVVVYKVTVVISEVSVWAERG